jgi:hypothetical protein
MLFAADFADYWCNCKHDTPQASCLRLTAVRAVVLLTGVRFFDFATLIFAVGFALVLLAGLALVSVLFACLACLT